MLSFINRVFIPGIADIILNYEGTKHRQISRTLRWKDECMGTFNYEGTHLDTQKLYTNMSVRDRVMLERYNYESYKYIDQHMKFNQIALMNLMRKHFCDSYRYPLGSFNLRRYFINQFSNIKRGNDFACRHLDHKPEDCDKYEYSIMCECGVPEYEGDECDYCYGGVGGGPNSGPWEQRRYE